MPRKLLVLLSAVALMTITGSVRSQPPAPSDAERARELFVEGAELARQYRWPDAIRAFERAARLRPHARTSYNLGYCERGLERLTRARRWFRDALQRDASASGGELNDEQRQATETYLTEVEARLARVQVHVAPADARVTVDDRPLEIEAAPAGGARAVAGTRVRSSGDPAPAATFELLVDPGRHEIVVTTADGRTRTAEMNLADGEETSIRLEVPAAPQAEASHPARPARSEPEMNGTSGHVVGAAVITAFSGAAAIVGTAFAVHAAATFADAQEACPSGVFCTTDRAFELSSDARTYGNLATAALVTAGASLAGAVILWVTVPSAAIEGAAVELGLGSLALRTRF